ncbi:MAG TPA: hypothetical protein VGT81_23570 [Casimicrobiaceae bacterium]|nr:hypothetical protein [Casimicrobiaceae bacterium]
MSLAGLGAVCIWHDLLPEAVDEFYQWHNREHMPERLGIAGFRRGRRFIAVAGAPTYFNLYEADNAEVLGGRDYLERLNSPTAWTRRVVASFRRVSRSICRVAYSEGVGEGGFMLTQRFDVDAAEAERTSDALRRRLLPPLADRKGIAGVHLCLADEAISRIETAEKKARSEATAIPGWIVLIEGTSEIDVRDAGERLTADLRALPDMPAPAIDTSIYQLQHALSKAR